MGGPGRDLVDREHVGVCGSRRTDATTSRCPDEYQTENRRILHGSLALAGEAGVVALNCICNRNHRGATIRVPAEPHQEESTWPISTVS